MWQTSSVILVAALASCLFAQPSAAQRLEESVIGEWAIDVPATKRLGGDGAIAAEDLAALKFRFEFKRDGGLVIRSSDPQTSRHEGRWKAVRVDEARRVLTLQANVGGDGVADRLTATKSKAGMVISLEMADVSLALRRSK